MKIKIGNSTFTINKNNLINLETLLDFTDVYDQKIYETYKFYRSVELKSSLDIEGEGSSRKKVNDLLSGRSKPKNENEQLLINLNAIYNYIANTPSITIKNFRILYDNLWIDIKNDENNLNRDEYPWRNDVGTIGGGLKADFTTLNPKYLNDTMKELFDFINSNLLNTNPLQKALIIMFWLVYAHPFYDYNGKSSRLLAAWFLLNNDFLPFAMFLSFALKINKSKFMHFFKTTRRNEEISKSNYKLDITNEINKWTIWILICIFALNRLTLNNANNGYKSNDAEISIYVFTVLASISTKQNKFTAKDLEDKLRFKTSPQALHKSLQSMVKKGLLNKEKKSKTPIYSCSLVTDKELQNWKMTLDMF